MTIVTAEGIVVSHGEICNFGMQRFRETIPANATVRIPIVVGSNKIRFIFRMMFGNITANQLNFRFDNLRNSVEQNLLLGTEALNFDTKFFPFLIVKEGRGYMVVQNTAATEQVFECTLHYLETVKQFVSDLEKYVKWKDVI